jgi:hypothetical protein
MMAEPEKDRVIEAIRNENKKYLFGTGFSMGFFIYLAKERQSKLWYMPAAGILMAGKLYADRQRDRHLKECELDEYFVRSQALESHLRYMELEIENYDKFRDIIKLNDNDKK